MNQVIEEIQTEREKQIKIWGNTNDDTMINGEIALGAAAYAANDISLWPKGSVWNPANFKTIEKVGRRGQLIRAATMIVAEIERMDRESKTTN